MKMDLKLNVTNAFLFVIIMSILRPYLQEIKYNACWILSLWSDHQYKWIENCVNDGYLYWEHNFISDQVNFDIDCPQIDAEELFSISPDQRYAYFQQLTSNGKQPLQIKNGISYFTNETFDIYFFLNKMKNMSYNDACITKSIHNETEGINDENFSIHEYVKTIHNRTALFNGYHRISILNVEDILPDFISTLLNDDLLNTVFGKQWRLKKLIQDNSTTQTSQLMIGLGKNEEKNKRKFHADLFTIFNFQLYGIKEWSLVDSKYLFQFQPDIKNNRRIGTNFNIIDKAPLNWDQIPRTNCIMKPSDILYVPISYLHKVDYINLSNQSDYSISLIAMYSDYYQLLQNHWQTAVGMLTKPQFVDKFCAFVN